MTREDADNRRDDMLVDGPDFQNPNPNQGNAIADEFNANYLKVYYAKLFPYSDMFKWMSYGNDGKHPSCDQSYFSRREFSFTLDDDIYLRYQSFKSVAEFESSVKEKCPFKIDIGPVFSNDPSKRHAYAQITPVERELVFDIDMTDYDDVRFCCSGADICCDCWPLMTVAIKVVDTSLRDDFGFNHILWVFSGRRGVHCWVCDAKARRLTNEQRAAITSYFHVYKGNENSLKKVSLGGPALHPFLARSYTDYLKTFFEETFLCSQKLLSSEERYEKVLDLIPDESITSELRGKWQDSRRSSMSKDVNVVRWGQLKQLLQSGKQKAQGIRRYVEEIVFSYVYPRLDMEVSKHMNHLLKAPFCVHPKTDVPSGCTYPTTSGPAGPVSNSTGIPTSPPGGINTPPGGMNTPPGGMNTPPGGMNTGPGMTSPPGIFSPTSFGPTGSFGDPSLSGATSLLQMSSYIVSLSLTLFAGLLIVWG